MQVLSWNLQGNPHARQALWAYLHQRREPEMVVCLQEWVLFKEDLPDLVLIEEEVRTETRGMFTVASSALRRRGVALVTLVREGLIAANPAALERACCVTVQQDPNSKAPRWLPGETSPNTALHFVNVHLPSRLTAHPGAPRRHEVAQLKAGVSAQFPPGSTPNVLLIGDWNSEPFEEELWHQAELCASRERITYIQQHYGLPWRPMYNPTWRLLGDRPDDDVGRRKPAGSHYFRGESTVPGRWKLYDQVIVSQDVADRWTSGWSVALVPELSGHDDLKNGAPTSKAVSDHLPLLATLPF